MTVFDAEKTIAQLHEVNVLLNSNIQDAIQSSAESREASIDTLKQLEATNKKFEENLNQAREQLDKRVRELEKATRSGLGDTAKSLSEEIALVQESVKQAVILLNRDIQEVMQNLNQKTKEILEDEIVIKGKLDELAKAAAKLKERTDEILDDEIVIKRKQDELSKQLGSTKEELKALVHQKSKTFTITLWIMFVFVLGAIAAAEYYIPK